MKQIAMKNARLALEKEIDTLTWELDTIKRTSFKQNKLATKSKNRNNFLKEVDSLVADMEDTLGEFKDFLKSFVKNII